MSRAYRISLSESRSEKRYLKASDGLVTALELIQVLDAGSMAELLAAELAGRGYEAGECGEMVRRDDDGVEIAVALTGECAGQVTVRLARDREVEVSSRRSAQADVEQKGEVEQRLREKVARDIETKTERAERELADEVTQVLEQKLRDIRQELAQVANRVTSEALKVRAAQLGEVREISEDPETGSLTIKVRV